MLRAVESARSTLIGKHPINQDAHGHAKAKVIREIKETSKNYKIRLFYFLFSCCLYNLWVLVNICVSMTVYGRIRDKPIITAKMFAVILYRIKLDYLANT